MKSLQERHAQVEKAIQRVLQLDLTGSVLDFQEREQLVSMKKRLAASNKDVEMKRPNLPKCACPEPKPAVTKYGYCLKCGRPR